MSANFGNNDISTSGSITGGSFIPYNSASSIHASSSTGGGIVLYSSVGEITLDTFDFLTPSIITNLVCTSYMSSRPAVNINPDAFNIDFTVYHDGSTSVPLFHCDADLERVGINTISPQYALDVVGSGHFDALNINSQYTFPTGVGSVGDSLVYAGSNQVAWSGVSGALSGQLDGNLDLNNYDIVGTGNITIDGNVTAEYFYGDLDGVVITECRNDTGSTIAEGTPVYVAGYYSSNGKPLVAPADCANATKMPAIGLLASELTTGSEGHVHVFGLAQNLPSGVTNGFSVGNTVYVDNGGGLTNVRPTGVSELVQNIGRVLKTGTNGRILVLGPGRSNDVPNSGHFEQLTVDGYTALAIDGGNVGIGTASPSYKLDIDNGDIRIGSKLIVGSGVYSATSPGSYFGLKHTDLTGPSEYMIMSAGNHTYISAKEDSSVYIRGGGNKIDHQIMVSESGITLGKYRPAASSVVAEYDVELVHDEGNCIRIADRGGSGFLIGDCMPSQNNAFTAIMHTNYTLASEYMMNSVGENTFLSAASGYGVVIRGGNNDLSSEIRVQNVADGSAGIIFNEFAADRDIRMEGVSEQNLFYLDASENNIGIGTATPSHKLHIADGTAYIQSGIISPTIAFRTYDIPLSGPTIYDGFIAYQNTDCWGLGNSSNDGFVFEKTDGNQNNPDGGIFFNVRGSGGVSSTAMSINGSKEIFIGQTGTYIVQGYSLNLKGGATVDSFNINNQFTFPTGDGTNSQVLATDGNGNVAWSGVSDILSGFSDHEVLTTSQQSFTVNGGYTVGSLDVYYNGLKLIDGDDYTATNGTSFSLSTSAGAGDVIEWEGHRTAPEYATIGNPGNYRLLISDGSSTTVNAQNDLVYTPTGLAIGTTGTICRLTVADSNEQGLCIHTTGAPDQHFLIGRNTSTGQLVFKGTQSGFSGYEFRSTIGTVSKTILETDRLTGAITFNDQYTFPTGVGNVGDSLVYDGNYNVVWSGVSGGSGGSSTTSLGTLSVTSSQSLFNTTDIYPSGGLAVFLNGVKLVEGEDFEETSNTSFTLTSPAASGDIVEYIAYGSTIASTNLQKTGDTMTGNLTVNADLIVKGYKETYINQGNTGTSQTISITNSTLQTYTLTDNCIFTMPTPDAGRSFTMFLKTGTGGYSATFTGVKWPSSSAPSITTTASSMDILTFYSDGTNWYGNLVQDYTP